MRRVVITGVGAITPIGNSVSEMWDGIKANRCGIDFIKRFDTTDFKVKLAGEVKDIDFTKYFDPKTIKNNDRFNLFARIAAREAAEMAKLDQIEDRTRVGVLFTSGIGGLETIQDTAILMNERGASRISPYFIPKSLINLSAGSIAIDNKCNGYSSSVVTACAAGTNAIGDAFNRIRYGYEDAIIAGGAEAAICPLGIGGFQALRALSTSDNPNRASIPFDLERSGFVMGEGAGCVVLEEMESAKKRGAKILAEVVGYGVSCDANHITAPLEDGSISSNAMTNALKDANIAPSKIDYINTHGTSTHLNDLTETNAIKRAFGNHAYNMLISSTKGNTGHLLGAAGAVEAVICVEAILNSLVPATINYSVKDPECDLNVCPNKNVEKDLHYVMSTSLGFGGHNAAIILKKWED
ncbi:MAG: beta-ketoacyl-ACP synthase II [Acholeplasmatales bacterium]|nr:beta-ketoacyl-ACP synthase II [Acholeplasmatales bacterium]